MGVVNGSGVEPDIRVTAQQAVAIRTLQRNIGCLRADAEMLQSIGEGVIAKAFLGTASILEGSQQKYIADTQRTIIPAGGVLVDR